MGETQHKVAVKSSKRHPKAKTLPLFSHLLTLKKHLTKSSDTRLSISQKLVYKKWSSMVKNKTNTLPPNFLQRRILPSGISFQNCSYVFFQTMKTKPIYTRLIMLFPKRTMCTVKVHQSSQGASRSPFFFLLLKTPLYL